jgi:glutamate 5-kinase
MEQDLRIRFSSSKRVVIKYGTRVLADASGRPKKERFEDIAFELAEIRSKGREVILVTSGAIGMGLEALGRKQRPEVLPELQMAAAVGQARLMELYSNVFAKYNVTVAQILLTREDFKDENRKINVCNTIACLLENGVLPIINENDAVSVDEIKFGDNDLLASLTATLLSAEALVLASTVDGYFQTQADGSNLRIAFLSSVGQKELAFAQGKNGHLSSGGMASKLQSAQTFVDSGGVAMIVDGRTKGVLASAFAAQSVGTVIG